MQRQTDSELVSFSTFLQKAPMERILKWFDDHWPSGKRDLAKSRKRRKNKKKKVKRWTRS